MITITGNKNYKGNKNQLCSRIRIYANYIFSNEWATLELKPYIILYLHVHFIYVAWNMKITFTVAQIGMTKYDNQLQLYFKIWGVLGVWRN